MNSILFIFVIMVQAGYDFAGWYGILKEQSGNKYETLYRIIKFILDFPVTIFLMCFVFNWSIGIIAAFYFLKWIGFADFVYIILWKIINPKRNYTAEGIWWLFWTPLGMVRSQLLYNSKEFLDKIPAVEKFKINKDWTFLKGEMTLREFQYQLVIGLIIFGAYYFVIK